MSRSQAVPQGPWGPRRSARRLRALAPRAGHRPRACHSAAAPADPQITHARAHIAHTAPRRPTRALRHPHPAHPPWPQGASARPPSPALQPPAHGPRGADHGGDCQASDAPGRPKYRPGPWEPPAPASVRKATGRAGCGPMSRAIAQLEGAAGPAAGSAGPTSTRMALGGAGDLTRAAPLGRVTAEVRGAARGGTGGGRWKGSTPLGHAGAGRGPAPGNTRTECP